MTKNIVTEAQLKGYIKVYLKTLTQEVRKLPTDRQWLFEIQKEQPMRCVGFISEKHGAAVAFFPDEEESIEIRWVSDRIESIFPKDPNTGDTLLQVEVGPHITFTPAWKIASNLALKNTVFRQGKRELAILTRGMNLTVDEDSVYLIEDRLVLKGGNPDYKWDKETAVKDAMWGIHRVLSEETRKEINELGAKAKKYEEYKQGYNKLKTELGIASESQIRELCSKFDGREVEGRLFGVNGKFKLPNRSKVYRMDDPEIECVVSNDEIWVVELKRRNRKASIKDIRNLEKKAQLVNANRLWFISESSFKKKATEYATSRNIMISDWENLKSLANIFRVRLQ